LAPTTTTLPGSGDWPSCHHDLARSGISDDQVAPGQVTKAWSSADLDAHIYTQPLVVGDSLSVAWTSAGRAGSPIIAASQVWTLGREGMLKAVEPATGALQDRGQPATMSGPAWTALPMQARTDRPWRGRIVRKTFALGLVCCAAVVLLSSAVVSLAGCESLDGSTATDQVATTSESVPETTTTTVLPTGVTNETSESPCLIEKAYTKDGINYLAVDYITVEWPADNWESYHSPVITNQSGKLRTFVVPDGLDLMFSFDELKAAVKAGDVNDEYIYSDFGFWDISVEAGYVVSLLPNYGPEGEY
jgi:hypothetical protein